MATANEPNTADLQIIGMLIQLTDMIVKVGFMVTDLSRRTESPDVARKTFESLQEVTQIRDHLFADIKKLLENV